MDQSCRLLDISTEKTRTIFRGHVDTVNKVQFLPFSNVFMSASADKTISLWDIRTGLCVQTFYGHINCINSAEANVRGESIASCDADGVVKIWDIKKVTERGQHDAGQYSVNCIAWDKSCQTIATGCDDGTLRMFTDDGRNGKPEMKIQAHVGSINGVVFEMNTKTLISVGRDAEYKLWN